jgi:hypothetical protein
MRIPPDIDASRQTGKGKPGDRLAGFLIVPRIPENDQFPAGRRAT